MNLKTRLGVYLALFVGLGIWLYVRACDKRIDTQVSSPILRKGVKEKLIVDPRHHTVTVIHSSGSSDTLFLPARPSAIEITDTGATKLTVQQMGTEEAPFVGFAYGDKARIALGINLVYVKKLDIGVAVFPTVSGSFSVRVGPVVSYNVYDNVSLFLGITNTGSPIGGLQLKI